jgi:putative transposase
VLVSFVYVVAWRLFAFVLLLARGDRSKELEILLLRHELSILRRKTRRPQLTERGRLLLAALSRVMSRRSWQAFLVTPETLLRWHRRIVARRWTYPHRRPGRPSLEPQVRELILRLARENSDWGYVRVVGELRKLGIAISATLVRNVLRRAGIPPAPERGASSWRTFLRQHGNSILACDLFTVDTVWMRRLYVLFFVSIGTRRVEYVACTSRPNTVWMTQQARNLLMDLDDHGRRPRFLIHDRDTKFSRAFGAIFRSEGIEIVRTPIQAPNANAHAERFVGSVRRECLDRLLIFGRPNSSASSPSTSATSTSSVHTERSTCDRQITGTEPIACRQQPRIRCRSYGATSLADYSTNTKPRRDGRIYAHALPCLTRGDRPAGAPPRAMSLSSRT